MPDQTIQRTSKNLFVQAFIDDEEGPSADLVDRFLLIG
jgi:hypothetical protein